MITCKCTFFFLFFLCQPREFDLEEGLTRQSRYHARQSLELYEHLFDDVQPTTEDEELRQVCLAHARELVEKGVEDEKNINDRLLAKYGSSEAVAEALLRRIGNQATEALGKQEAFLQAEEEAEEEIQEGDQGQQTSGPEEAELAGNEHDERVHDVVEETPAGEVEREEQQSPPTNPFLRDGSLQLPRYPPLPEGTMTLSEMMKKGLR